MYVLSDVWTIFIDIHSVATETETSIPCDRGPPLASVTACTRRGGDNPVIKSDPLEVCGLHVVHVVQWMFRSKIFSEIDVMGFWLP